MATDIPVFVPRRAGDEHRDMLWEFVRGKWFDEGWTVVEGHHDEGLFSRSAAINKAARSLEWKVAIIADADVVFEDWDQPREAAELAEKTGSLAYAHTTHNMLPWDATQRVLDGEQATRDMAEQSVDNTMSSCMAISRQAWETVGGFDERFYGWGCDDWGFMAACEALVGIVRAPGNSFHLWHPRTVEWETQNAHYQENEQLGKRYFSVRGNVAAIRTILSEPGGPLAPVVV